MKRYADDIAALAMPVDGPGDFGALLARVGDASVVMLGEASHGTHEFYRCRADFTRRLIEEKDFSFVAVEGDWPDCERVDRSVRCFDDAPEDPRAALEAFERWPTWMWANEEVTDFCRWLRGYNEPRDPHTRVGFHGLDVYSLWESLREIMMHVQEHDPEAVSTALAAYRCFEPYGEDPQRYALATRFVPTACEDLVVDLLSTLRAKASGRGGEEFSAWQNAEVVTNAARYYRAMIRGGPDSWNVRDRHMALTLDRLLTHYSQQSGRPAKAVVWAHNTHVGDARGTDMAQAGEVNIGQLARERYGADDVVLVGLGTHRGTVVAGSRWGAPWEVMPVPPARTGSLEAILHEAVVAGAAPEPGLFVFPPSPPPLLTDWLPHRAIGVVYDPTREYWANYVPTRLADRYDAFVWLDETRALRPLPVRRVDVAEAETYPAGV
jgi:erythromycin esterase-like protein